MSDPIIEYFLAKASLFKYFTLPLEWIELPIDDATEFYWRTDNAHVEYSETEQFDDEDKLYEDEIYTQRFFPKHIYRGKAYTLIFCDPHVDGCKWWRIFDNTKERPWKERDEDE